MKTFYCNVCKQEKETTALCYNCMQELCNTYDKVIAELQEIQKKLVEDLQSTRMLLLTAETKLGSFAMKERIKS